MPAEQLLEAFGKCEHHLEQAHPGMLYSELLTKIYGELSREFGAEAVDDVARAFGQSVGDWQAFPDFAEALAYLKQHFRLVILSNVDRQSFAGSNRRLGVDFDHIFTAEEIGSYKPDRRNFDYCWSGSRAGDRQGRLAPCRAKPVPRSCAGQPARHCFGVDRPPSRPGWSWATPLPDPRPRYDFRFTSLGELAAAHRAELA